MLCHKKTKKHELSVGCYGRPMTNKITIFVIDIVPMNSDIAYRCPGYDIKRFDGKASALKIWGM